MNLLEWLMAIAIGILIFAVIVLFRRLKGLDQRYERKSRRFGPNNRF